MLFLSILNNNNQLNNNLIRDDISDLDKQHSVNLKCIYDEKENITTSHI